MAKKATAATKRNTPTEQDVNLQTYFSILNGVQDQIRFADRKGAFFFAMNALLFGFIGRSFFTLKDAFAASSGQGTALWISIVVLLLYGVGAAVSVAIVVWSVVSRFGELAPKSKVYFGHIIREYGKDYAKYVKDTREMSEGDWAEEIGTQIVEVSHIALTKHRLLKTAAWFSLGAFIFWVLSFVALAFVPVP